MKVVSNVASAVIVNVDNENENDKNIFGVVGIDRHYVCNCYDSATTIGNDVMGNRLSKIVTKTGDDGTTGLGDGSRVLKSSDRMEVIGDVDELNTCLGLVMAEMDRQHLIEGFNMLRMIQHRLFDLGGELSVPDYTILGENEVDDLEAETTLLNDRLSPLKNFILPGGSEVVTRLHHARAVCRRAERSFVRLAENEHVNREAGKYINRLSDYLFVLARVHANGRDVLWEPKPLLQE